MQVNETNTEGLKREFTITVPASEIDEKVSARIKEIAPNVNMPGFRPGKVPFALLRKRYASAVMGEVLERTVGDTSRAALDERGIRVAGQPRIEVTKFDEGGDLEYTMAVEMFPEFDITDLSKLKLVKLKAEVPEEEVTEALERIASTSKSSKPVTKKRAAKSGDILVIDFVGRVDGEEFPGGKAESYQLELGSGSFIPGFEDQLIGINPGDEKAVTVKFPDDYGAENLAGKEAVFDVTVKELRENAPAEANDELATKMGFENLEALKKTMRDHRMKEFDGVSRMRLKKDLFDMLADKHSFDLPPGMVENEFEAVWKNFEEVREKNPDSIDEEDKNKSDEELKKEYRALSERRVRLALIVSEIGRLNKIDISEEEMNRAIMAETSRYPGQEQAVLDYYRNNPQAVEALHGPVFEDKIV
ncbi:MAG: trigger factor, partial [Rhodospirillales bacterium]|nr:trigger factor [Rhodospirillales bacterium]